jgi:hypothetical protein
LISHSLGSSANAVGLIATSNSAFKLVENPYFLHISKGGRPAYEVPNRKGVAADVDSVFDGGQATMARALQVCSDGMRTERRT